jgi:hypothetical protein
MSGSRARSGSEAESNVLRGVGTESGSEVTFNVVRTHVGTRILSIIAFEVVSARLEVARKVARHWVGLFGRDLGV